jgi:prepilin-type N-terminal cleavage/methylation domain-containing protein
MNLRALFLFGGPIRLWKTCALLRRCALRNSPRRARRDARDGFTLVEVLVVIAIMAIMLSIVIVSVSGVKGSRDLYKAAYDIQGVLEQARTLAMATGTYTWVGFFEEDPSTPGVAGTGQVVISMVSSAAGTNLDTVGSPIAALPASQLTQVTKLMKISNVHLAVLPTAAVTRPTLTASAPTTYQVGSGSFSNTTTFPYPLTGTAQYNFTQIIQFSPQGDATRIADYPTQLMEIGLQPTHGDSASATITNAAVIQIAGIGGQVITYRP